MSIYLNIYALLNLAFIFKDMECFQINRLSLLHAYFLLLILSLHYYFVPRSIPCYTKVMEVLEAVTIHQLRLFTNFCLLFFILEIKQIKMQRETFYIRRCLINPVRKAVIELFSFCNACRMGFLSL